MMSFLRWFVVLSTITIGWCGPRVPESEWGPLDRYVWKPDDTYRWTEFREDRIDYEGDTVYFLNLTSQTYIDADFSDWPVWWHYMVVIVPEEVLYPNGAMVFVGMGRNSPDSVPTPENDIITEAMRLFAYDVGCIVVYLKNIPNQPIRFKDDPTNSRRSEDSQIAYTWRLFIEDPEGVNVDILSRFPMTKAVVRAMDATTELLLSESPSYNVTEFIVGGASKRGWTTWTTAAVDDRVIAQVPMVMSLLQCGPQLKNHFRSLGGWSFAFNSYYRENLTLELDNPNTQKLWDIVDPYTYISRFTIPTMVISGTSDQFFLPDESHYFFNDLPGTKIFYMMAGLDHSMAPWIDLYANARPFVAGMFTGFDFPQPTWDIVYEEMGASVTLRTSVRPIDVYAWYAVTEDGTRRDFRLNRAGGELNNVTWYDDVVETVEEGVYQVRYDNPDPGSGWLAFFIEVIYDGPGGFDLAMTSEVAITPNTYPYEECHGRDCFGTIV